MTRIACSIAQAAFGKCCFAGTQRAGAGRMPACALPRLWRGSSFILLLSAVLCAPGWLVAAAQQAVVPIALPLSADGIMARVAANQDSAERERRHFVYVQHARVQSRKGKTVLCEEISDARIVPSAAGSQVVLLKLDGRYLRKRQYVTYSALPPPAGASDRERPAGANVTVDTAEDGLDRSLVESLRASLTSDDTRDGLAARLFPLTSRVQAEYVFRLIGQERMNGRNVFHIAFRPKDKDTSNWKGEAYIDDEAFEPVVVSTEMAEQLPFAVHTLLGTSLPGLGFTVTYEPQADGTWFPSTFGTEFKIHVLFFFSREIVIEARNRDFERTHVTATILPSAAPPAVAGP